MRSLRFIVAAMAMAAPSGCALFGFDLGDYGGGEDPGLDSGGGPDSLVEGSADVSADGTVDPDAADAPGDTTTPDTGKDGGRDTGSDGGGDTGSDGGVDAAKDTGVDTGTDTGVDSAPPPCNFTTFKRVFVSSKTYSVATLVSLSKADMECDDMAAAAGIFEPSFRAWLSDDTTSAAARIIHGTTDAYVLMDKTTVVACTWNELLTVPHRHAIDHDESKIAVGTTPTCGGGTDRAVWTGTLPSGATDPSSTCGSWTKSAGAGTMGAAHAVDAAWTSGCSGNVCGGSGAIYCIEQ